MEIKRSTKGREDAEFKGQGDEFYIPASWDIDVPTGEKVCLTIEGVLASKDEMGAILKVEKVMTEKPDRSFGEEVQKAIEISIKG